MKVIMKNLLRIITTLLCLSLFQCYGIIKPIRKRSEAVEASAAAKTFIQQVLRDYELDPNSCKILAYNDPNSDDGASADSIKNIIYLNEAFSSFNSFDLNKNAFQIYVCYHEVGHIKDRASQKIVAANIATTLISTAVLCYLGQKLLYYLDPKCMPNSSTPSFVSYCSLAANISALATKFFVSTKFENAAEIRADILACEQLLKEEWGLKPISEYLFHLIQYQRKPKTRSHDAFAEYDNIAQLLKKHEYDVQTIVSGNRVTITIIKNNIVKLRESRWI